MPTVVSEEGGCEGEVGESGGSVGLLGTDDAVQDLGRHL